MARVSPQIMVNYGTESRTASADGIRARIISHPVEAADSENNLVDRDVCLSVTIP